MEGLTVIVKVVIASQLPLSIAKWKHETSVAMSSNFSKEAGNWFFFLDEISEFLSVIR